MAALFAFSACLSCKDIDLPEKPDKVIENAPGTLYYSKDIKRWCIRRPFPGTIDSVDNYIIVKIPDKKFHFEEGKEVFVSGFCYYIPFDEFKYNKDLYGLGGLEWYYIKVTDIKYKEK